MFLTAANMVHYLLARNLISAKSVVDGDFVVVEAGRRNRNFKIIQKSGTGLFVKQIKEMEPMAISTLQREAACYRMAQGEGYHALAALMPRMVEHDDKRHCLTLELLPSADNLAEYHMRAQKFPAEIGQLLGAALGSYHQTLRGKPLKPEDMVAFPRMAPWILSFHQTHAQGAAHLSGGVQQMRVLIRNNPDFAANLERLRQGWMFDAIIHGDIKWDNCLILHEADGMRLKVIDWELVDYGDASWDIGAVFQAYLCYWIYSMPLAQESSPQRYVEKATCSVDTMIPAIHAFWRSYCQSSNINAQQAKPYLLRCIEYGAARMVQTAFEALYSAPAMHSHAAAILQVSQNILRNPRDAASALFGFAREVV